MKNDMILEYLSCFLTILIIFLKKAANEKKNKNNIALDIMNVEMGKEQESLGIILK